MKEYTQVQGIDYEETFSSVVRYESIRYLLIHATLQDWKIEAMDVKLAYLHGVLEEEIYMEQPEGFEAKKEEDKVYRLMHSLYGLKQAGQVWNMTFATQSKGNWVLTQYTLIQVYMYYTITIKGEILKWIWSSFYMLMTYYSWEKTNPRLKT